MNVVFFQFPPHTVFDGQGAAKSSAELNLRRTYRRTSVALARLLANMGVSGATPLLSRFSMPVSADPPKPGTPAEGRWSQGLYLDQPEAWDDPYRFFRW